MDLGAKLISILIPVLLLLPSVSNGQVLKTTDNRFGPFDPSYYDIFSVVDNATISTGALQVTPDSAGNLILTNQSGRVMFNRRFKLWDGEVDPTSNSALTNDLNRRVASFNTSFLINISQRNNSPTPGEGLAFVIAPDQELPLGSHGQYLGLTNATTDGSTTNHLIAIEFDTVQQDFDPDDNHMGLNINSVRSEKTVSLSDFGFRLAPEDTKYYMVWIEYDGAKKLLRVYMADEDNPSPTKPRPASPIMTADLDISTIVTQYSYFGFAASTGTKVELNCVLRWNLTMEELPEDNSMKTELKIAIGVGVPVLAILLLCLAGAVYYLQKKWDAENDPNILGTLKTLPGTPREFKFRDLKKATNNFDEKLKLGQGGFGVIYKGVLPSENLELAVKKFTRDNIKGKDDFLAELTIINRLRHKHLVPLLGWCYENRMLLLVYDFMPNGSLDHHIFCEPNTKPLGCSVRHKILSGVASALHYLHNEYDQKVVHRDLKPSNIMLDSNFNARLGDFGLARAIDHEKTSYAELDQPGVPGTMGYIAPECLHTGKATRESDVYGFGAVVLEVVCGQRPWTRIDGYNCLVDWVWSLHREGRILEGIDERLGDDYVAEEAKRVLLLGLACSHPTADERPQTAALLQIISGSVAAPTIPPFRPAFVWPFSSEITEDGDTTTTTVTSHFDLEIETRER